jgi:diguanylate cyclase (GGDEF)-like protein
MALKSLHQFLLTRFGDRLAPEYFSLPTLHAAIRCLFESNRGCNGKSYFLIHLPTSFLRSIANPPVGALPNIFQWYRVQKPGNLPEHMGLESSVRVKSRDPFHKEIFFYGSFNSMPMLLLAQEVPQSNNLFRTRPTAHSVIWSSDLEVMGAIRELLAQEYSEWYHQCGKRFMLKSAESDINGEISVLSSFKSMEQDYRRLVFDRWKTSVVSRFQQMAWDLIPEQTIRQVGKAFKEHTNYDHFELTVKHYPGLPSQPDGAFSIRESKLGGELLSIIMEPDRTAELLKARKPVFMPDVKDYPVFMNPGLLEIMNIRSGLLMPLWDGNNELGLVKIFFCRRIEILPAEFKLLTTVAEYSGRALSNALQFHLTERRATIDGLTDVFNHRFFTDQIRKEFNRARRYKNALAMIMLDIDHFKEYNDANGHLAGDRVLVKVADLIQSSVREIDLVARYGGDEFALILPENDARQGLIVAEKVRKVIEDHYFENEEPVPGGTLTISLGISDNSHHVKSAEEMIEVADQALYWVKRHGGNRSKIGNQVGEE